MEDESVEIVAGATEGAIRGMLAPITDFASAVFGEPASEVGGYLGDGRRMRRFERQVRMFKRANEMLAEAGIDPSRVDWKVLTPLVAGAADEEDDSMAERWAALLANAAAGEYGFFVHPSFPRVLSEMSALDAALLNRFADGVEITFRAGSDQTHELFSALEIGLLPDFRLSYNQISVSYSNLDRMNLCRIAPDGQDDSTERIVLTEYGSRFLKACSPPKHAPKTATKPPTFPG